MFWLLLMALFLGGAVLFGILGGLRESGGAFGTMCFFAFVGVMCLIIGASYTMYGVSAQTEDVQMLRLYDEKAVILQGKADNLTKQFAGYLAEAYPQHEKNIYNSISPEKVSIYMVKYPDLKASETMVKLVSEIGRLQDAYYEQLLLKQYTLKNLRFRPQNPWLVRSFIPVYAEK